MRALQQVERKYCWQQLCCKRGEDDLKSIQPYSPIPGEGDWGNIRAMEEMKLPVATLHKCSHDFTSEESVPTLSQHSRQELLTRRQTE